MQSYFYYVIIPDMVFIPKLTHDCQDVVTRCRWDESGCGSDYILVFAGTQHKQQQSISLQYHKYLLAYLRHG